MNIFFLSLMLGLFIFLTPAPAAAEWSFSIYGPSGYVIIAGGTVTIGAAVVIGCLYIWGEGRIAQAPDLPQTNSLAINPEEPRRAETSRGLQLDLVSFDF
jgi:hypothetical protein